MQLALRCGDWFLISSNSTHQPGIYLATSSASFPRRLGFSSDLAAAYEVVGFEDALIDNNKVSFDSISTMLEDFTEIDSRQHAIIFKLLNETKARPIDC